VGSLRHLAVVRRAATTSLSTLIIVAVQSREKSSWYLPISDATQPRAPLKNEVRTGMPRPYFNG
jgi:hypothetical protein